MFTRKMPKCQMPDKNEFTEHSFHSVSLDKRVWPEVVNVISIDPGIRNLALRVESRGIRSSSYPIKTLVFDKLHIKDSERSLDGNTDSLYSMVNEFLDQYLPIFKTCHMMIIERQLPFNLKATRISQHIITYFMIHLKNIVPSLPKIFEIDPKLKGRELGASTHLNERGLKQWSVDHAKSLLTKRQDYEGLEILRKHKKKADDLADTLVQIESLFSFQKWPLTAEIISLRVEPPKLKITMPTNIPTSNPSLSPNPLINSLTKTSLPPLSNPPLTKASLPPLSNPLTKASLTKTSLTKTSLPPLSNSLPPNPLANPLNTTNKSLPVLKIQESKEKEEPPKIIKLKVLPR